jgi:hypothetical protein
MSLFSDLQAKAIAGTLTPAEANDNSIALKPEQRNFLHLSLIARGGAWGGSSTLPASNAPVTKTVTDDTVVIPASLHYSINVIDGAGISWGGNDLPLSGYVDYPPRVDGQAYPEVTIIVASGTTILVSYQPK